VSIVGLIGPESKQKKKKEKHFRRECGIEELRISCTKPVSQ